MKVPIIAVNYNNSDCSIGMIESLLGQFDFVDIVVVVDNASIESEKNVLIQYVECLPEKIKNKIKLILLPENVGYFKALNIGIAQVSDSAHMAVVGNNDLIYDKNFLPTLNAKKFEDDVFVVCPDVVTIDGVHQNPHVIRRFSFFKKLAFSAYYSNYYVGLLMLYLKRKLVSKDRRFVPGTFDIFMGIGACYVLTKGFLDNVGRLDDRVFLYGEEAFLANQVRKKGGRLVYCSDLRVEHLESVATSKLPPRQKYQLTQKSYRIYKKYL